VSGLMLTKYSRVGRPRERWRRSAGSSEARTIGCREPSRPAAASASAPAADRHTFWYCTATAGFHGPSGAVEPETESPGIHSHEASLTTLTASWPGNEKRASK